MEQPTERHAVAATSTPSRPKLEIVATKAEDANAAALAPGESALTPQEMHSLIEATVSAHLGQRVRIRSVKLVEQPDEAASWATQGRIAIHSSHTGRPARD